MTAHLIRGDARRLPLATGSVQAIVTSPPYFGLRSYGGQTTLWGGDPDCEHVIRADPKTGRPMTGGTGPASAKQVTNQGSQFGNVKPIITGGSCVHCGATRCELGSEPDPQSFVAHLIEVMRECWRVLRDDGVAFVNMGDSYAGSGKGPTTSASTLMNGRGAKDGTKVVTRTQQLRQGFINHVSAGRPKSLLLVPERLAIALSDDGWIVRQVLIWSKNNPMPESVRDRWTTAHEYVLMLVKQPSYFFDQAGIQEPVSPTAHYGGTYRSNGKTADERHDQDTLHGNGHTITANPAGRNGRSVWNLNGESYAGAHFATFPREIPRRCILAASREGDVVLDPFSGSGTSAYVAASLGRVGIGVELSEEYIQQARYGRLAQDFLPLAPPPPAPAMPRLPREAGDGEATR